MAAPAELFGQLLTARLAGRPLAAVLDVPATPPTPRLPAPNVAQGSSGRAAPPQPSPLDVLADLLAGLGPALDDGGWKQLP
ncbi:MAG: hypothetical protein ACR2MN_14965 [Acidimicrobiales bacterium]